MLNINKFIALIASVSILFCAGCAGNDSTADKKIRFAIDESPATVDPQCASSSSELLIVRNCFEGLYKFDENGKAVKAICKENSVSDNGLSYTFTLRDDAKWSDGSDITAQDFVFALKRAVMPETNAPDVSSLFCIKGARDIYNGNTGADSLGVIAENDKKLTINLAEKCYDLYSVLSSAIAMPCNKAFFESTGGKYGLAADNILCNGAFDLQSWSEKSATLIRNDNFTGGSVKPSSVLVTFGSNNSEKLSDISDNITDGCIISPPYISAAEKAGLNISRFYNVSWAVIINPQEEIIGSDDGVKVLSNAINRDEIASWLPENYIKADYIVPPDIISVSEKYRKNAGFSFSFEYDEKKAAESLTSIIRQSDKTPPGNISMLYVNEDGMKLTASRLAQQWQKALGLCVNIEQVNKDEMYARMQSGNYQLALCPLSADDSRAETFLRQFESNSSFSFFDFKNSEFDSAISEVSDSMNDAELSNTLAKAEKALLSDGHIIPFAFSPTAYATSPSLSGVIFDTLSGNIDFSNAGK